MKGITRVISFTSGKGGVGKTSSVVSTAIALAREGKSVLLLDADLGLANIDVMLGVTPRATIHDVLRGEKTLEEVMINGPEGISIIPAASGVESICNLDSEQQLTLMRAIEEVAYQFDYLLIDTAAGIGTDVMFFNSASREIVCVVNPEPTSLTDAYALIKVLSTQYGEKSVSVLVNNVRANSMPAEREAQMVFNRLSTAVERFLHIELKYLGFVPSDPSLIEAIRSQRALMELYPSSPSGLAFASLARKIDAEFHELRVKGGMQFFFQQLLEMSSHG
ncbi:MAG: MinD/ParA family protein [Deltaproteobacteria bacterium]|nr:MinD/ParA family protein [Deltaproteobacteria bacterium]